MSYIPRLYTKDNWEQLHPSSSTEKQVAYRYLSPFVLGDVSSFISNINTEIQVIELENHLLPVTINQREYQNAYSCSPITQYITCAKEELWELRDPYLEKTLSTLLSTLRYLLKLGQLNRVVIVNNWLLSTNLYPPISQEQINWITSYLIKQFPKHAILFRSITAYHPIGLHASLLQAGYQAVPSRQVYYYAPSQWNHLKSRQRNLLRRELRFYTQSAYQWRKDQKKWTEKELHRIIDLYQQLYIEKYSPNHPRLTTQWLQHAIQSGWLHVGVLEKAGQIDAAYGYFMQNKMMTTPLLGYQTSIPQKEGLYRILSRLLVKEASANSLLQHQSSGAAAFKRDRGAFAKIEYTMAYTKHLPFQQRKSWAFLQSLLEKIALPIITKRKL
ncbi:Acetyltransferase (GNAT) domain-containing protein [Seinonella peptonophila]|uniref:Acetyltransferase (GNAT) domain-containing protein n=1 Tax=Seinonella peptonophila TaxID=112248 RepID=A0A1M4WHQ7_9BACL|nr:GNAT family N-acetyltransferase [Seinonella peptonophila]SHE80766.1 Acetyltransferase (GNAT) domain-containing protein [Seinonella peptonophila]